MKEKLLFFLTFLLIGIGAVTAQTLTVTGTVTSEEDGEPIMGASVLVKGTKLGGVTNLNGQFTINNVPQLAKTLVVSYIGMLQTEASIKPGHIKVVMKSNSEQLDEVIVVAYGTAKKSSLTGAVSSVDSKAIEKTISSTVTGALEGAAPGIQVNNTYGEPGTNPQIRIRGIGTINGDAEPLYVVDGAPYDGRISDLNSADIESMTVLKDAASAALYGNRAANGVVIITTKKGAKASKPTVTFTTNHGAYVRGIKEYDRLDANQWMEAEWTGMKNYAKSLASLGYDDAKAAEYATTHLIGDLVKRNIYNAADDALFDSNGKLTASILPGYTDLDWADEVERTGYRQEYGLAFANGSDNYNVYASLGYLNEKGYVRNTGFERYSARLNANFTPTKWFKGGINVNATSQNQNFNGTAYGTYYANPFYVVRNMAPVYPIYAHNEDGSIVYDADGKPQYDLTSDYLSNRHIIYELLNDTEDNQRLTLDANAFVTFTLPYGFDVTLKGTKNFNANKRVKFNNSKIGDGAANNGRLYDYEYRYETTNFQQQLTWNHDYGVHHVDALLAHESYEMSQKIVYIMNINQSLAGNYTLGNFTSNSTSTGSDYTDATESYLGRARYNYDSKYFLEASWRRDGSSRFAKDSRWGNFYSVGAAWDIMREDFMKEISWIDYLKLRLSYGEVGNNSVGSSSRNGLAYTTNYYAYQALYFQDKYGGDGALIKMSLPANDLRWETTQTVDVALEGRVLDRIDFSLGFFDKRSKDLLFAVPLPSSAGGYIWSDEGNYNLTQLKNIGSVSNKGIELSASADIIRKNGWTWNFGFDATFLKNKIEKLPNGQDIANGTYRRYSEGHSIYDFYTYHFVGVDEMTGNSLYTIDPEKTEDATKNGKLVNINGTDYTTDTNYGLKDWAGSAVPKVYGSVHTGLDWKGLSLNVLMTYSLGGKIYDSSYAGLMSTAAASARALHKDILKSWSGVPAGMTETSANRINPNGTPLIDNNLSQFNNATSDRWLTSASYLVLKNISLSYELPKKLVHGWGLQSLSFNTGVENAFTFTARQGLNPQYSFDGTQDATYTTARIFNVGMTLKF